MILTRKELAEKMKVTVQTVINWQSKGMPILQVDGIDPRYDWDDVKKWLSQKREVTK
jgi:phage terminase Nu1 subunit (DNA packaging protein)